MKTRGWMVVSVLLAVTVWAAGGWVRLGTFSADGLSKQLKPGRVLTECRFVGRAGQSKINTVVVRAGSRKVALRVGASLAPSEEVVVPLEIKGKVTILRISDGGGGKYEVFAR